MNAFNLIFMLWIYFLCFLSSFKFSTKRLVRTFTRPGIRRVRNPVSGWCALTFAMSKVDLMKYYIMKNFIFSLGEELLFKCEDTSDSHYCKSHSQYDDFLMRYRKDAYKAKAYIHQMISRCYSTSICNGDLLNSTLLATKGPPPTVDASLQRLNPPKSKNYARTPNSNAVQASRSVSGKLSLSTRILPTGILIVIFIWFLSFHFHNFLL